MDTNEVVEFAKCLQDWHGARMAYAREIQEGSNAGTKVLLQSIAGEKRREVELTEHDALIFRLGMEAGLACFDKLPFTMQHHRDDDIEEEDSHV